MEEALWFAWRRLQWRLDVMSQIHRFEEQISQLEQRPVETGKVMLYGSSFFAHWGYDRSKEQWFSATNGALEIVNHGFGGATVEEMLYYYHRMVLPYKPRAMVFRTGHNDVWQCSAQECFFLTQCLFNWVKNDFPDIPMIAIKAFDTPSSPEKNLSEMHTYNMLLDELAQHDPLIRTLDINPFFHTEDGSYRDVFIADGLHLTDSGYKEMAAYLAPKIFKLLQIEK